MSIAAINDAAGLFEIVFGWSGKLSLKEPLWNALICFLPRLMKVSRASVATANAEGINQMISREPDSMGQEAQPVELTPEQKMAAAQADQDAWARVAADPSLSPKAASWARGAARSAAAEVRLREKAAEYRAEAINSERSRSIK